MGARAAKTWLLGDAAAWVSAGCEEEEDVLGCGCVDECDEEEGAGEEDTLLGSVLAVCAGAALELAACVVAGASDSDVLEDAVGVEITLASDEDSTGRGLHMRPLAPRRTARTRVWRAFRPWGSGCAKTDDTTQRSRNATKDF